MLVTWDFFRANKSPDHKNISLTPASVSTTIFYQFKNPRVSTPKIRTI